MNNSSNVLLSIVTINKNNQEGLIATSNSVKKHFNNSRVEWIIVDGGSSDESVNYMRKLVGSSIQTYDTKLGLYESMNFGAQRATGKYLIFMNSGDRFTRNGIESALEFSEKNDCDWIVAQSAAVDSEYTWQWDWPIPSFESLGFKLAFRSFCHQATFIKRSTFLGLNGFEVDSLFSDWQMSLKLAEISKPLIVETRTTEYLIGGLSARAGTVNWALQTGKLRRRTKSKIFGSNLIDMLFTPLTIMYMAWKKIR